MTLVVRDEADIIDAQIAYHLNAGVDFVIATDHDSRDGTTEILDSYARSGYLLRVAESGWVDEEVWRTRMARLAATDYDADWIINTDADEFWWPRGSTLKDTFRAVPDRFGTVGGLVRHLVPRPDDGTPFYERMIVRVALPVALNDPTSPWRPGTKVAHRADPDVVVLHASHSVVGRELRLVPGWCPFDILHFPYRSLEQWSEKTTRRARGDKPLATYVKGLVAREEGRMDQVYGAIEVDDATVDRGREDGSLVIDTRVRDALRPLRVETDESATSALYRLPPPDARICPSSRTIGKDEAAATDLAALYDATLVRLQRRVDNLARRTGDLELRAHRLNKDSRCSAMSTERI